MPAEIAMKSICKVLIILGIISVLLTTIPSLTATTTQNHEVTIDTIDDTYSVKEKIILLQDNNTIRFYIQSGINDLSTIINNTAIEATKNSDNIYVINYTDGVDKEKTTLTLTYTYPKNQTNEKFTEKFTYDTTSFNLKLDQETITSNTHINKGSTITVHFPEKQSTTESLNLYTVILIALLVVLLIVTTIYGFKKRKNESKRNRDIESTELLSTEKALLMQVLKEIEKKHRNHKISDETYEKLKTYYKQQTVDIMTGLED